jgi:hypothetical protein
VLHLLDLAGQLRVGGAVGLESRLPRRAGVQAALSDALGEVLVDAVRDVEVGILGHSEEALGGLDRVRPQRLAVRDRRVLDGGAVADVAVHQHQRGPLLLGQERVQPALHRCQVVDIGDGGDVPAVGDEAGCDVLGERDVGVPLDRDPVGVVDPAQVGQLQVPSQRRGLR